jgi:hypothetical protein
MNLPLTAGRHERLTRCELLALLLLGLSSLVLVIIAWYGDEALIRLLTSEAGPIEWVSARTWFVIAAIVLWRGPRGGTALALAGLCLMFGLRELDLHKVVADTSFLKRGFYRDAAISAGDKWLGGVLAAGMVGLVLWGLVLGARTFWRRRLHRTGWGRIVLGAAVVLVLSKLLDRIPNTLVVDYGIALETHVKALVSLHEEWLECYVPLVLAAAAWQRPPA